MKYAFLLTILIFAFNSSCTHTLKPKSNQDLTKTTVMITNLARTSGGTGVVLSSTSTGSAILTNAHVCEVAKNGGYIKSDTRYGIVKFMRASQFHDLCVINTSTDFGINTIVAEDPPELDSDASIVGNPKLVSNIITRGNFSRKSVIQVMRGLRPCTTEERDSELGLLCAFIGGIPIITYYETQAVGATIQPGSSGSPVFNDKGEISGLVFAGSGDLSYAYIVPQEYIYNFVHYELGHLDTLKPNMELDFTGASEKTKSMCTSKYPLNLKIKMLCNLQAMDMVFRQ